jgi:deazaflavin-dependent oxidoreductase (nitroreductase family)
MAETSDDYNTKVIGEFGGPTAEETPLLLLHHTGAMSGVNRVNPVAYLPDDGRYFIWAANGGAPKHPAWYHNLKEHPVTRIEVSDETIDVVAEEASGGERDRLFARATERYPQLADILGFRVLAATLSAHEPATLSAHGSARLCDDGGARALVATAVSPGG